MTKVGIDFSLISPAICIQYPSGLYRFISFFDDYGKDWKKSKTKKFHYHQELYGIMELIPYTRIIEKADYKTEQLSKMKSAKNIAHVIIDKISTIVEGDVIIGIEGFSYGSISSSTLDLAMYNSFLRIKLLETFGDDCIVIVAPTEGKKTLSDVGNANKNLMIESFIQNRLNDEELTKTPLWNYCKNNNLDYNNIKPIDDLVDSYAILKSI
ncbi:MAG: hypothetical protein NC548_30910 [Lachnospiraceae bacterium]|nr:hypothetical protein [Lachnospiraceae bacterium]